MKRKCLTILLILSIFLSACGSMGVSEEEYSVVKKEKEELQLNYDKLEESYEIVMKLNKYKLIVEKDYELLSFIMDFYELTGLDTSNIRSEIDDMKKMIDTTIETTFKVLEIGQEYESESGAQVQIIDESTMEQIEELMDTWNNMVTEIKTVFDNSINK